MIEKPNVAVILGSTRPGRRGEAVAHWVLEHAQRRDDADFSLVDLATYELPLLAEATVPAAANRNYETPQTRAWSAAIDAFDAYVLVTPEYNHGVPAALKNAVDVLYPEWNHKGFALVSYGAAAGVRAVEQWRGILANVHGAVVRGQVSLSSFFDWKDGVFAPIEHRTAELDTVLDQLVELTRAVSVLRAS